MELYHPSPTLPVVPKCRLLPLELLRQKAYVVGRHVEIYVKCDRCGRSIIAPVSCDWVLRMSEDKIRFPGPVTTMIRVSPQLCPGYNDGSCIAMRTPEYIQTWMNLKPVPGVLNTDRQWLELRYPPAEGYSAPPEWQGRLKRATKLIPTLTPPYIQYLHWRFAWHLFWHHKGMRHKDAPLERMWGNVAADVLLWHFQLLGDADLEALYCTSVRSLVGLLVCQWDCGITILEMFCAVRRDLDKPCFNPLKSAVQRADTAMRKYITAHVARASRKEQFYRRLMVSDAFLAIGDRMREYMGEEEHLSITEQWTSPLQFLDEYLGLFIQDDVEDTAESSSRPGGKSLI
ncbi:hypothetical protein CTA2_2393 [Colletotrichum tanaceti]|uniref:Uncharacterized protein n=1 Tax=Colletotrichum tanaceti TaxID=1306861 RepID=A0A4U6X6W9_9PEZI|nr:hypothetical protein CTA2_2393 [Colletotrichum tanaceti]TKW51212.1 hypothetical protein CTA1_12817 [Colletotrichum tanaceti]